MVLERTFRTQSIDQVFLEPEAGLAWYDSGKRRLELVLGVQSPQEAAGNIATLVAKNAAAQAVTDIVAHCAEVGGAFGGKDHTIYPLYVALAGLFSPDRPVRLANDRYDQFQFGLKRHALTAKSRMAVDRASGRITAFVSDQDLDGGGLANLSPAVAFVGATASIGIYDVPKVDVTTEVRHSRAVTAGSMRGFGALQTMTALEVMIDEAAASLGRDPIAFRKTNLLATGGKTMVGNVISGDLRSGEVLDRLAAQPIWTGRAAEKARRAAMAPGKAFGVGVACVSTVFGSGSDPAFALVEIDPAGRITVTSQAVEIGTGVTTALAVRVADRLGGRGPPGEPRRPRGLGRARAHRTGQSVHADGRAAGGGREEPAMGSRYRPGYDRFHFGSRAHRGRRRGSERRVSVRPVAGGAGDLVSGQGGRKSPAVSTTCVLSTAG